MFRKYFQKYGIHKMNYLLTNTVLCQTLNEDGTTGNPEKHVIEMCKENCMETIKRCDPKLVVLMGTSPMSAFGIAKAGITVMHEKGEIKEWKDIKQELLFIHHLLIETFQHGNRNLHKQWQKLQNQWAENI